MLSILKFIFNLFIVLLLTVLTQVGGIVYILSMFLYRHIDKFSSNKFLKSVNRITSFVILYCIATFLIVPIIAKAFGRERLPLTEMNHLQPLNFLTCLLNRNYVKPELKQAAIEFSVEMNEKFPVTTVNYLDANFPFYDGFPLMPHLSHNDGKKLDLSFCYLDAKSGKATNECPSFIGYGISEEPLPGEINTADECAAKGFWQYSFLKKIVSQSNRVNYTFDGERTKKLIEIIASNSSITKIFIEPHLKERLKLTNTKIRFHGCRAVRHDDHIHVQL